MGQPAQLAAEFQEDHVHEAEQEGLARRRDHLARRDAELGRPVERVNVRTIAAEVLGVLGIFSAAPYLEDRLGSDPHASVRVGAAHAVGRLGLPSSIPGLLQTIARDQDADVLAAACTALGRIADPSTMPALERAVSHPAPRVRIAAALAMILMGSAGMARLRLIAQQDALGGDAAREILARFTISVGAQPTLKD